MGTKNSDLVSNFEATPQVLNNSALLHGVVRVAQGTIALAAGDSNDDDVVMLAPIPSNATISNIYVGSGCLSFGGDRAGIQTLYLVEIPHPLSSRLRAHRQTHHHFGWCRCHNIGQQSIEIP